MGSDSKGTKRLHEDDGDAHERDEGANVQPLDVISMQQLLESMGADKFEPRVVAQLQEFVHRYVTEILVDTQEYSMYADKQTIDPDDIRLAISSRLNHHYAQVPPREKTPNTPRLGDATGFGSTIRGDAARPPIHPRIEGSRNKKYARRPIPININSNM
ncbi:hypothetical protein AM588_10005047 [Phytophthora nicotianae]|uniref:Transcription initiation factor TFIID subunit 9 n=1 Tax=Phytophthora nicotianae TaxID=4792 RepID=A0A0W8CZP7_PHYNI|nr:hypothetical protein AM588_10005047 [Phytophthora nicotianae]